MYCSVYDRAEKSPYLAKQTVSGPKPLVKSYTKGRNVCITDDGIYRAYAKDIYFNTIHLKLESKEHIFPGNK